ncbi:MAG TPA: family 10 glycosylhydrolase [Fimbriimonas sp.]
MNGKHWVWDSVNRGADASALREKYRTLRSRASDGVFLGGGIDDREFEIVREAGLELHPWMWTTNRGDAWIRENHPEWYMVSRSGKSCLDKPPYVDYYRWVSPVVPGVQAYLKDRVAELAKHPAVNGVHLDYVRYPDVILPRGLWGKYGLDQSEELPDYDFDYSEAACEAFRAASGRDPKEILDPARDQEWLHFRYESVNSLVRQLTSVAHEHGKEITAAVFPTPSMSRRICRQDWDKWPLDGFCPMIYHSFYHETAAWIGECVIENIQAVRQPVYAGLYMPAFKSPGEFRTGLEAAIKRGAAGISLFGGVGEEYWAVFEETVKGKVAREVSA